MKHLDPERIRHALHNVHNSAPGQPVYDPFLGSGTTMIAAEMEGRCCFGMELSPAYCDVIVTRWQAFTGEQAMLGGDGRTFDEVNISRKEAQNGRAA
jgi:hypothetical protein